MKYIVYENEGFGVMEDPMKRIFQKEFTGENAREEALAFLDEYRKDKGKSWANWETPYTYELWCESSGGLRRIYDY